MTTLSTLYNCAGVPQALVVAILPGAPGQTGPTGQACVGGQGFGTDTGAAAPFVFASLQGTISTWNAGTTAVTQFTATDHAIYTGLTVAGANLYAADARERQRLTSSTTPSTRYPCQVRSRIPRPAGFAPYIQNINASCTSPFREGSRAATSRCSTRTAISCSTSATPT